MGWGIYNLRRRFRFHDETHPLIETATLVLVFAYLAVEIRVLETWFERAPGYVIFAVLGLVVSAAALYGHMAVSLLSWLIVDFMMPGHQGNPEHPRMGPEEALEREKDYAGALDGYLVLARIYPRNTEIPMRIVSNLLRLDRAREAPSWLERALACCADDDAAAGIVTRLCEVYEHHLDDPGRARAALDAFLEGNPRVKDRDALRERLDRIGAQGARVERRVTLMPLAEAPLEEPPPEKSVEKPRGRARLDIAPLAQCPLAPEDDQSQDAPTAEKGRPDVPD